MPADLKIKFIKISPNAQTPTQAKPGDAGYDLYAVESAIINPLARKLVGTGLVMEIPQGYYARIAPRSGLAINNGIDVLAGVCDSTYRGEVKVVLINLDVLGWLRELFTGSGGAFAALFGQTGAFRINAGDRIAQVILEKCHSVKWEETTKLSETERAAGTFGSSGN